MSSAHIVRDTGVTRQTVTCGLLGRFWLLADYWYTSPAGGAPQPCRPQRW
jgi:hypothetical protein